jgi:hypothetical protein
MTKGKKTFNMFEVKTSSPHQQQYVQNKALDSAKTNRVCCNTHCTKGDVRTLKCSACGIVRYCSVDCQRAAWDGHKLECRRIIESEIDGITYVPVKMTNPCPILLDLVLTRNNSILINNLAKSRKVGSKETFVIATLDPANWFARPKFKLASTICARIDVGSQKPIRDACNKLDEKTEYMLIIEGRELSTSSIGQVMECVVIKI